MQISKEPIKANFSLMEKSRNIDKLSSKTKPMNTACAHSLKRKYKKQKEKNTRHFFKILKNKTLNKPQDRPPQTATFPKPAHTNTQQNFRQHNCHLKSKLAKHPTKKHSIRSKKRVKARQLLQRQKNYRGRGVKKWGS
jgi:hypothetical protein